MESSQKTVAVERGKKAKSHTLPKGLEPCLRCGEQMVETYCKTLCTNCGYMRDCNDQW